DTGLPAYGGQLRLTAEIELDHAGVGAGCATSKALPRKQEAQGIPCSASRPSHTAERPPVSLAAAAVQARRGPARPEGAFEISRTSTTDRSFLNCRFRWTPMDAKWSFGAS